MCVGPRCTENGVLAEAMFGVLGEQIDARPELRVKRTRTHCMVACKAQAPVVVVYPEGVWYRCEDASAIERVTMGTKVSQPCCTKLPPSLPPFSAPSACRPAATYPEAAPGALARLRHSLARAWRRPVRPRSKVAAWGRPVWPPAGHGERPCRLSCCREPRCERG